MTKIHRKNSKNKRFDPFAKGTSKIDESFIMGLEPHLTAYSGSNPYSVSKHLTIPFDSDVEGNFWQTCEIDPQIYPHYAQYSNCIVIGLYDYSAVHVGYHFISPDPKAFSYQKIDKKSYEPVNKTVYFNKKTLIKSGSSAYWSGLVGASGHNLLWVMDRIYCAEGFADAISVSLATGDPCQIMTGAKIRTQSLINQHMNSHLETVFVLDMKLYGNGSPFPDDQQPQLQSAIKAGVRYVIPQWRGKTYKDINDLFIDQGADVTQAVLSRIDGEFIRACFDYDPFTRLVNVNSQYVPIPYEYIDQQTDSTIESKKWIVHVRVGCGGGKTTRAREFLAPMIDTDRPITVLIHSVALSVALSDDLGILNYQPSLDNKTLLWATRQKTMSVQSIHGMPPDGITDQVFIFDEIMQGITEILTNPEHIRLAVETLKSLLSNIRNSSISIFMDAHMGPLTYRLSSEFPERHKVRITNHYQSEVGNVEYEIADEKVFDSMVWNAAEDPSQSMLLASGTARKVVGMALVLSPDALKKTIVVCGEEHKEKDFLDKGIFIGSTLEKKWRHYFSGANSTGKRRSRREAISLIISNEDLSDINLMYSPSIKSGVSIDVEDHNFQCTFNYFENYLSPPETFHQMKKRARGISVAYNFFKSNKANKRFKKREEWHKEIVAKYQRVDVRHLKGEEKDINILICDLLAIVKETQDKGRNDPLSIIKELGSEYGAVWKPFDPATLDLHAMPDIDFDFADDLEAIKAKMRLIIEGREEGDFQDEEEARYRYKLESAKKYTGLLGEDLIDFAARDAKDKILYRMFLNDRLNKPLAEIFRHENVQVMRNKTFINYIDGIRQSRLVKILRRYVGVGLDGQLIKGITHRDGYEELGMENKRVSRVREFMRSHKAELLDLKILAKTDFPKEIGASLSPELAARYKSENAHCAYTRPEKLQMRFLTETFPQNVGRKQIRVKKMTLDPVKDKFVASWTRPTIRFIDRSVYEANLAVIKRATDLRWEEEIARLDEAPAKREEFAELIRNKNAKFKRDAELGVLHLVAIDAKLRQARWRNQLHSSAQGQVDGRQPMTASEIPVEEYQELNRLSRLALDQRKVTSEEKAESERAALSVAELNTFWDDPENSD